MAQKVDGWTGKASRINPPRANERHVLDRELIKFHSHCADKTREEFCFYGSVGKSHTEHKELPQLQRGAAMRFRKAIATASDPAIMMERVLAETQVLVPSADGAVIGLCTTLNSLVFAAASGNLADSVGSEHRMSGRFVAAAST